MQRVLVTGAAGQIGSELTPALRARHGIDHVTASDLRAPAPSSPLADGPFASLDVRDRAALQKLVTERQIDTIYHLAAILSATGESNPQLAWDVNINGLVNVLEVARASGARVFCPSSIAVFGPETPHALAPQTTVLHPSTLYGLTKVAGELLGDYYVQRYGVDVRGLRYPGIISSETPPGGGTTDYAVDIFYQALQVGRYTCFVRPDTVLPMMYMPDCIRATLGLMDADPARLTRHCDYNVVGLSFSAGELAVEIAKHVPGFSCSYDPDFRQAIADSWPQSLDDRAARADWDWSPSFDLSSMTEDMLRRLRLRLAHRAA